MVKLEQKDKSLNIFNDAVEKYSKLLKLNMEPGLLNETAIGIVESTPQIMHKSLMLKFTFMLGYSIGLTREQINKMF